jgi:biopolymer transport protein TolR
VGALGVVVDLDRLKELPMSFTPGSKHGQMADINMTPMIDVMLVLLIIFMVAAPMLTTGVEVNLPESKTGKSLDSEAITVSLARDGRLQFEKHYVEEGMLKKLLREKAATGRKRPVMVRADNNIPYGRVIAVVDAIREAGFTQVGFVTQGIPATPDETHP